LNSSVCEAAHVLDGTGRNTSGIGKTSYKSKYTFEVLCKRAEFKEEKFDVMVKQESI
jgi:hypothetical protein